VARSLRRLQVLSSHPLLPPLPGPGLLSSAGVRQAVL
jgi:hypothetical protein